jgi:hypothetical protein
MNLEKPNRIQDQKEHITHKSISDLGAVKKKLQHISCNFLNGPNEKFGIKSGPFKKLLKMCCSFFSATKPNPYPYMPRLTTDGEC